MTAYQVGTSLASREGDCIAPRQLRRLTPTRPSPPAQDGNAPQRGAPGRMFSDSLRARRLRGARGLTLVEVLVALAILSMIAVLLYASFDAMSKAKKNEGLRGDRAREGRSAVQRIARELTSAFLSAHQPQTLSLQTRTTAFIAQSGGRFDRVDFASFAHRRVDAEAKESDQAEIGYFVVADPDKSDKMDLVRREQTPIDLDPKRGGTVNLLAENVESFDMRFLDPTTGQWIETWDSSIQTSQLGRIPLEVQITLVLKDTPAGVDKTYTTKIALPIQRPLTFGISQ
ncbi:N/A [soil metagenome]